MSTKRTLRSRASSQETPEEVEETVAAKQRGGKKTEKKTKGRKPSMEKAAADSPEKGEERGKSGGKRERARNKASKRKSSEKEEKEAAAEEGVASEKRSRSKGKTAKSGKPEPEDTANGADEAASSSTKRDKAGAERKRRESVSKKTRNDSATASDSSDGEEKTAEESSADEGQLRKKVVEKEAKPEEASSSHVDTERPPAEGNLKLATWNVAGLRSLVKKNGLTSLLDLKPDVICMQEVKASSKELPAAVAKDDEYFKYWLDSSAKKGYAGCALWTKQKPLKVTYGIGDEEHDGSGRVITAEFPSTFVVCVYVPNAGRKLVNLETRLKWNTIFAAYVKKLDKAKPVVIGGDMNVAHNEIDLKNPKSNKRNAGFTQEERDGMTKFLGMGFTDVYRHLHPDEADCYTFWSYMGAARAKNVGWRLDYFIVSTRLLDESLACSNEKDITGSDHCPVILHFGRALF